MPRNVLEAQIQLFFLPGAAAGTLRKCACVHARSLCRSQFCLPNTPFKKCLRVEVGESVGRVDGEEGRVSGGGVRTCACLL